MIPSSNSNSFTFSPQEQQREHRSPHDDVNNMMILFCYFQLVTLLNPNAKVSSLAMIPMGDIVAHTMRVMMVETAHKLSDFPWIYKGWKIFNKKYIEKLQIDFSQQELDETQFFKRKSILQLLFSRIDVSCVMF
jgi:hypothetical protein